LLSTISVPTAKAVTKKPTRKTASTKPVRERPYWIGSGENVCADCDCTHAHAVEARCADCDAALCPMCAVHDTGEIFCSVCDPVRRAIEWQPAHSGKA
jgi:hypothetical protein